MAHASLHEVFAQRARQSVWRVAAIVAIIRQNVKKNVEILCFTHDFITIPQNPGGERWC